MFYIGFYLGFQHASFLTLFVTIFVLVVLCILEAKISSFLADKIFQMIVFGEFQLSLV